jgi:outer membrane receptor for ferrienterochelin and colicins
MNKLVLIVVMACLSATTAYGQDSLKTVILEDFVFTGQYEPQSVRKSVYQVRTINYDRIALRAPVNVQSVLSTELGIRFTNDLTLGTSDISLMGMSGQNVKILLDGIPLLDRGATRESLNQIDVNTLERIEIVEGPMSVVYGTDALAGVINLITKKYDDGKLTIEAKVQEETAGDEYSPFRNKGVHQENVSLNWQGKSWNAGGGITRNVSGGWQEGRYWGEEAQTISEWHPKDQWLGTGTFGYRRNDFSAGYRLDYSDEVIKVLGGVNPNTNVATDKEYQTARYNHQLRAEGRLNDRLTFNGAISYQDYSRRTLTTTVNVVTGDRRLSTDAGSQDKATFNTALLRGMVVYKLSDKVTVQPGVDVNLTTGSGDRIDKTRSINDYAVFISSEFKPFSSVNVRPGLRFIYNSVYDAPPVIPSVNTKFILSRTLDLRAAYAYGFRSPALRELYFSFFDASHSIKGNPDLKAEHSNSFSGSLVWQAYKHSSLSIQSTLGGFYNDFENLIDIGIDPADPQVNTYINVDKYRTTGATLENNLTWKKLHAAVGVSYIRTYNLVSEADATLPSILWTPEVTSTVSYAFEKIGASISFYYKYTGKRSNYEVVMVEDEPVARLSTRASFQFADVSASKKVTQYITVNGGVKNLFDVTSIRNSSLDTSGSHSTGGPVPIGYGRSYFLAVNFRMIR